MDVIQTTFKNFSVFSELFELFSHAKGYEYTKKGVIRAIQKPDCPHCDNQCCRNGWDPITRKNLLTLKIGRFRCPNCGHEIKKDLSLFTKILDEWYDTLSNFFLRLTDRDVAFRVMSELMNFLNPMSKDTVLRKITSAIKQLIIPELKSRYQIVHYDEQHPKKGRHQHYRLTLIDAIQRKIIADDLYDDKESHTISEFLSKHLNTSKELIIITDGCPWYPELFKKLWGNKVKHQMCILHLNKLIVADCGKLPPLQEIYDTYLLLDIFFNRQKELDFLQVLLEEEKEIGKDNNWLKQARKRFNKFVRNLEKMRRRDKVNHQLRTSDEAKNNFDKLVHEKQLLPKSLQKRLKYIGQFWDEFNLFYDIDCPHTNNVIENYFSTSLKTHRKKQFRTKEGLERKMRLSVFKRNVGFSNPVKTFFEWGKIFWVLSL
ncbi:MAG: ISNCY family transposase [Nanoarchaeota archaeon]|nr:ISNCY family transposase [Nanoarchaeota archaeon]